MDKFLETYNLPKMNQEESENMNRLIINNEIDAEIEKLSVNKSLEPGGITCKLY